MNEEKLYLIEEDIENFYELENGWWVYTGIKRETIKYDGLRSNAHVGVDPRLCPECGHVWMIQYDSKQKLKNSVLLSDFPKYNLKKEVCYFCKNENK